MKRKIYIFLLFLVFATSINAQSWPRFFWNQIIAADTVGAIAIATPGLDGAWSDSLRFWQGKLRIGVDTAATLADVRSLGFNETGTANTIPLWATSSTLGDSWLSQGSGALSLADTRVMRFIGHTTAGRPTGLAGHFGYNTSNNKFEFHNGTAWANLGENFANTDLTLSASRTHAIGANTLNLTTSTGRNYYFSGAGMGIGTSTIALPLEIVKGSISPSIVKIKENDTANRSILNFGISPGNNTFIFSGNEGTGGNLPLALYGEGSQTVTIKASKVGINNSSPLAALDVIVSTGAAFSTKTAASNYSSMAFGTGGGSGDEYVYFQSAKSGTGILRPIEFFVDNIRTIRAQTDGNVIVGSHLSGDESDVTLWAKGTDALYLPTGTTAQRPTGLSGYIRFNETIDSLEYYDGAGWASISKNKIAENFANTDLALSANRSHSLGGYKLDFNSIASRSYRFDSVGLGISTLGHFDALANIDIVDDVGAAISVRNGITNYEGFGMGNGGGPGDYYSYIQNTIGGTGTLRPYIIFIGGTRAIKAGTNGNIIINSSTAGETTDYNLKVSGTSAVKISNGGTAQRPTAIDGLIRYNGDINDFEGYDKEWKTFANYNDTVFAAKKYLFNIDQDTAGLDGYVLTYDETSGEIGLEAATGGAGDDWGADVVNHDGTLTGNGTSGTPLKVDTSLMATTLALNDSIANALAANPDTNLGITDITFTGNRTQALGGNTLTFDATAANDVLVIDGSTGDVGILGLPIGGAALAVGGTESVIIPSGTTAQEPTPQTGMIRHDATKQAMTGYQDGDFRPMVQTLEMVSTTTGATIVVYKNAFLYCDITTTSQTITLDPTDLSDGSIVKIFVTNQNDFTLDSDTGSFFSTTGSFAATQACTEGVYEVVWDGTNWFFYKIN